jgi:hypothetical protein
MNDDQTLEILQSVVRSALEDCAFLLTAPALQPVTTERSDWRHALIEFDGPSCGYLRLSAPADVVAVIASDMLGTEPRFQDDDGRGDAALRELANVVAGLLTAELFGIECPCDLGIPETRAQPLPLVSGSRSYPTTLLTEAGQLFEAELVMFAGALP